MLIIWSVIFLAIVWIAALGGPRSGYIGPICLSLAGIAGGFCIGGFALLLTAFLVGIVAIACAVKQARLRSFYLGSVAALVIAYGIVIVFFVIPEQRQWASLEAKYPIESLEERLAPLRPSKQADSGAILKPAASHIGRERLLTFEEGMREFNSKSGGRMRSFEEAMEELESGSRIGRREMSLKHLHTSSVARFIQSQGFGIGRLRYLPTPSTIPDSEPEPISMPVYDLPNQDSQADDQYSAARERARVGQLPEDMHESSLISFFDPRTFGYVEDLRHVVGFQPHAFHYAPSAPRTWHIDKLELVSLLKHEEPAVYLSEHLPRMRELQDAPTRPLDDFEKGALTALQDGKDVQIQSSPDQIRMLGSIRAVKQCLKCHGVERGDLLGAFTYDLRKGP